jgi:RNA polymerase sigma factor (sigma-70 family)
MPGHGDIEDSDTPLLRGDSEAFAEFYRRHEQAVLAYFRRRTANAELVADLTAETFAQALASKTKFRGDRGPGRAWLFGIASHVLSRSIRRKQVENRARRRLGIERLEFSDVELERIHAMDEHKLVQAALEGLAPEHREAVLLRVVADQSYADIAEHVQCSEALARQRVRRGLRAMRTRLEAGR